MTTIGIRMFIDMVNLNLSRRIALSTGEGIISLYFCNLRRGDESRNMRFIGFKRRVPGLGRFHIRQRADPFIDVVKLLSYQQFEGRFGYV
jgi:hypothetical protein